MIQSKAKQDLNSALIICVHLYYDSSKLQQPAQIIHVNAQRYQRWDETGAGPSPEGKAELI